jgi:hypothetical protein
MRHRTNACSFVWALQGKTVLWPAAKTAWKWKVQGRAAGDLATNSEVWCLRKLKDLALVHAEGDGDGKSFAQRLSRF